MMCSGPFSGAQGHSNLQTRTDRRGPHGLEAWRSGISTFRSSIPVLQQHAALLQYCCWNKVPFGGLGGWEAGGWVLLGWTGLVLSGTTRNPARLVYGSAALVASLRGQQSHFATLPTNLVFFVEILKDF